MQSNELRVVIFPPLILAAFEEFKSQMQQHLSQVEERMVLLEAENRTLKGEINLWRIHNYFSYLFCIHRSVK
jgi:hypothetical protein